MGAVQVTFAFTWVGQAGSGCVCAAKPFTGGEAPWWRPLGHSPGPVAKNQRVLVCECGRVRVHMQARVRVSIL